MTNENTTRRPRRVAVRIFKVLAIGGALLLTIAVAAHFTYMYSGSGHWEKVFDKKGIAIYTLKSPGSLVKRVKGVTHVRTTMNTAVSMMMKDADVLENCKEWFPGCVATQVVQPWDPQERSWVILFRVQAFRPFSPREFLVRGRATQDPRTKAVLIDYTAVPDEIPENPCCVRVAHLGNSWRFTPQDNGVVEVENRINLDIGIPYFMFNRFVPYGQWRVLGKVQKSLDKRKGAMIAGILEKS